MRDQLTSKVTITRDGKSVLLFERYLASSKYVYFARILPVALMSLKATFHFQILQTVWETSKISILILSRRVQ